MSAAAAPRPPAVTLACVFVGFSAFLLLLDLVQALTEWGTIEMQKALQPTLGELKSRGLDLTMAELLSTLRWVGLFGVLLLVSALVFAIYAARGDQASRIGLTVLAGVVGLFIVPLGWIGLMQAAFLFLAAWMLWSPDARAWYAVRQGRAKPADLDGPARPKTTGPIHPAATQTETAPATTTTTTAPPSPTGKRPRAVLAAGLVTVIGSSMAAGLAGIYLLVYGFAREEYVRLVQDGPFADLYSPGELESAMEAGFWGCLVMLPLALAGLAAGISLLARLRIGRIGTLALAWVTAAAGVVLLPVGLVATGAAVTVIVLLNRAESRAWK